MGILDTLTTAIKDGYCPHASKLTVKSYLRPTGINIFHIAAALDSEEMSWAFISGYRCGEISIRKLYSVHYEPHREKTGFLPRRKQRRRSASR